ncbi:MAG: DUF4198 domain-containing protein [Thermogutta sp.]
MMRRRLPLFAVALPVALFTCVGFVQAHQIWIEAPPQAEMNKPVSLEVCFGHSGDKTTGPMLASNHPKLRAIVKLPDGQNQVLTLKVDEDGYATSFQPHGSGFYPIGAILETGIIERELHGIPPKTRIIMTGKAVVAVGNVGEGYATAIGHPLEIVPLTNPCGLRVGSTVKLRILFNGQPIGGPEVLVRVGTLGPVPKDDPQLTEREWGIEGYPDSRGELCFPLIASGQHVVFLRYFDRAAGEYNGPMNFSSEFSHLQPGDRYDQTLYMTTLTFQVAP